MVEKVILENVSIILVINYTPLVFYFTFTIYFISTEIIVCTCLIYKVKYFNVVFVSLGTQIYSFIHLCLNNRSNQIRKLKFYILNQSIIQYKQKLNRDKEVGFQLMASFQHNHLFKKKKLYFYNKRISHIDSKCRGSFICHSSLLKLHHIFVTPVAFLSSISTKGGRNTIEVS